MRAGAVLVLWAALALWGVVFAQPAGFADVAEGADYSLPVASLAERGVFVGTECDEGFCPGEVIDRRTMAVWTVRVLDGEDPPAVAQTRFDDVDAHSFHAAFIERMADLDVTVGCGDGTGFCPDRAVSRAQMAAFLSRAYDLSDGADPGFSDVADEAWYAADVARLAASKITVGCGDGTVFCPSRGHHPLRDGDVLVPRREPSRHRTTTRRQRRRRRSRRRRRWRRRSRRRWWRRRRRRRRQRRRDNNDNDNDDDDAPPPAALGGDIGGGRVEPGGGEDRP